MDYFHIFFLITGVVTGLMVFQFFLPQRMLALFHKANVNEEPGLFFASHWGLLCFVIGGLIVFAAFNPQHLLPVLVAAAVEKLGLITVIFKNMKKGFYKNMLATALFDSLCVITYTYYIITQL